MADPHVVTALIRKHAELAGELQELERQKRSIRQRLTHVDQTLKMVGYKGDFTEIAPRLRYRRMFRTRELKRLVLDIMRQSPEPLSNSQIAVLVIELKRWDSDNDELRALVSGKVKDVRKRLASGEAT